MNLDLGGKPRSANSADPETRNGDPLGDVLMAERRAAVRRAVAVLDEPYREVVALGFFSELSLGEISQLSGRPLGTVKTHLHRGLIRLRQILQQGGVS